MQPSSSDSHEDIYSDASSKAVGVVTRGNSLCYRSFEAYEQATSSTWRELTALFYALKAFRPILHGKKVTCYVDNFAASRIVEIGSPNLELQSIAVNIFDFCKANSFEIQVTWIPRKQNAVADKLSKFSDPDDWEMSIETFNYLDQLWGPFSIDRFASEENHKLSRFNSRFSCPSAEAIDEFSQNWERENNLLVPQVSKIPDTIYRISTGNIKGTFFVPYWRSSVFWALLKCP